MLSVVKLSSELLGRMIRIIHRGDTRCMIGPRIGEDAAVIDIEGLKNIVVHSDPITGAENMIGRLSVIVPSNDVACEGGDPRWISITMLLPENYNEDKIVRICEQIREECDRLDIDVVGGHSEYTPSLSRPIIVSTCIGTCSRPLDKRRIGEDNLIVLARSPGIEASLVIATDMRDRLRNIDEKIIEKVMSFQNELSIVPLARAIRDHVIAMHDPTEGGIFQALYELARASMRDFEVWLSSIKVRDEIRKICEIARIDPLRSLSSGCLIAIVSRENLDIVMDLLKKHVKDEVSVIGRVRARSERPSLYVLDKEHGRLMFTISEDVPDQVMSIL